MRWPLTGLYLAVFLWMAARAGDPGGAARAAACLPAVFVVNHFTRPRGGPT